MRLKDSPASEIMGSTWFLHHCQARPRPPKGLTSRSNRGGLGSSSGVISAKRGEGVYRGHRPRPLTLEAGTANSPVDQVEGWHSSLLGIQVFSRASGAQAQVCSPAPLSQGPRQRQGLDV